MTDKEIKALDGYDFREFAKTVDYKEELEEGDTPIRSLLTRVERCGQVIRGKYSIVTICRSKDGELFYILIPHDDDDAPWCAAFITE